jgi:hypothetical protein
MTKGRHSNDLWRPFGQAGDRDPKPVVGHTQRPAVEHIAAVVRLHSVLSGPNRAQVVTSLPVNCNSLTTSDAFFNWEFPVTVSIADGM